MSLKMEFVEKASRPGARMSELCREYGVSRETGYKWLNRYKREGYTGLEEKSRAPHSSPLKKAEDLIQAVLKAREANPTWGPTKLLGPLKKQLGEETPSHSTIARILRRFGQVKARRARRPLSTIERAPEVLAKAPNDAWTVDFKGWWRSLDGYRCEPLTVRDAASRYILAVAVMESTAEAPVREVFERLFRKHGLPKMIQCDNGTPFIAVRGRGGLTKLSAWWVSLGIQVVRSRPGCPQDNGAHERMHRDISAELEAMPQPNRTLQQRACDKWRQKFNHVRPHEALGGKVPAEIYKPSVRRRLDQPEAAYPDHWIKRRVARRRGTIVVEGQPYNIGLALSGYTIALEPLGGLKHRVWFRDLDLGEIELAPPRRIIDSVVDAFLERPFRRTSRSLPSTSQPASLPPAPPSTPPQTCAQQILGSSAVSSAASK